jgi:transposase
MLTTMTEQDWKIVLQVFQASRSRRGDKGQDDRRFLEALHYFVVHNITWRALPAQFGHWNSVWKRYWRLSRTGTFEAFFDTLAAMTETAHLVQMFDHDAKLQAEVRSISKSRKEKGEFGVGILFWEDIVASLLLNPTVFQSHYPQVLLPKPFHVDRDRLLAALELGYKGADLWAYIRLIYGEYGWMAQTDPDELLNNLQILKTRTQFLIPTEHAAPIVEALENALDGCKKPKADQSDWDSVEIQAKRASMRLLRAASLLPIAESNILRLGAQLGQIYFHVDDLPAEKIRTDVEMKVRNTLPSGSSSAIEARFLEASSLDDGYRWALRIYSLVEREIRFAMQ